MTVTKEILQDLKIISMNLINESDVLFPCIITKYDKGKLVFSLHNNVITDNRISLQVVVQEDEGNFINEVQALYIIEKDSNYIIATIKTEEQKHNKTIMNLLELLSRLDLQDEKYGRRKEPRIKLGKEKSLLFGLSSAEQKLFSKSAKIIQPCAIIDASIHGICIITPYENPAFKNIENFNIHLSFINPEQTVILQAHKVSSKINDTQNKVFSTISCQLLEPINYIWKERVIKMIETDVPGN